MNLNVVLKVLNGHGALQISSNNPGLATNVAVGSLTSILFLKGNLSTLQEALPSVSFSFQAGATNAQINIAVTDQNGLEDAADTNVIVNCNFTGNNLTVSDIEFALRPSRISVRFTQPITLGDQSTEGLFPGSETLLGRGAVTTATSSTSLTIFIGDDASVATNSELAVDGSSIIGVCGELANTTLVVPYPTNAVAPVVAIQGPTQVGSCSGNVTYRAIVSEGSAGRSVTTNWTTLMPFKMDQSALIVIDQGEFVLCFFQPVEF